MFKTNTELIVIDAKATKPINTDVVFWSHDKGTAKLLFQLKKGIVSQTLAKGTIVPICLVFIGGRHIYHAVIEDAVNGIVSIVLEDNILGYVGRVDGSIYIELPDSRSLDTAGRFTFDIKRSPIDENVPELEDYYWQGFNEIMTQYHETIATIKLEAKVLLDSLTADVTKVKNDIATANTRIEEINQKIDDNDVFTKQESSANVVDQVSGIEEASIKISSDFLGKVAGSNTENANNIKTAANAVLLLPSAFTQGASQSNYNNVATLDKVVFTLNSATDTRFVQKLVDFDVVDLVTRRFGDSFWALRNISTRTEKVNLIKDTFSSASSHFWNYGFSPNGNKVTMAVFNNVSGVLEDKATHSNSVVTESVLSLDSADYISSDGHILLVAYAEASNGVKSSSLYTDYIKLDLTINISAHDQIESMIAANHVQNLATQDEAEAGTDNTKSMTPLRTAQQIDKRAVTIAGNQTVGGLKNFKDGLLLDGDGGLFQEDTLETEAGSSVLPSSSFSRGTLIMKRKGKAVQLFLSFSAAKVLTKNTPFLMVPTNWRPMMDSLGSNDASASLLPLRVWMTSSGGISANKDIPAGNWVDVSLSYLID